MLILLPPSEGKARGGDGPPVIVRSLSFHGQLGPIRTRMVRTLVALCKGSRAHQAVAREILGLSEKLDDARAANASIRTSPTMIAGLRYVGVLYDALGYSTLPDDARRLADDSLITFSGLWGAVRPVDPIPAYRIGINTRLPGEPTIPAIWRAALGKALDRPIAAAGALDFRSAGYSQMAALSPRARAGLITVNVNGPSFGSKYVKGLLVRSMLMNGSVGIDGVLAAAEAVDMKASASSGAVTVNVPAGWQPAWLDAR